MIRVLVFLAVLLGGGQAYAQCSGSSGVPFNCLAGNTPAAADYVLGGSNTSPQSGKTVRWTWADVWGAYAASSYNNITINTTGITGGTNGYVLYNNAGTIGQKAPTITINGTPCDIAGTCTITTAASSVAVGTTTVTSGTNGYLLYNNGGVLGNLATSALTVSFTQLPTLGANQVLGSVAVAKPSGLSMPSCPDTGSNHLNWVSGTGFVCGTAGSGTVSSVGLSMPAVFTVTNSPITSTGTLAVTANGTSGGVPYFNATTTMASSAALTSNALVLGGGAGAAPKTAAGFTTDGTSALTLGVAGASVGSVAFKNATSGTITLAPTTGALGTVTLTAPARTATLATTSGALTNGNLAKFDASGNIVDGGVAASAVLTSSSTLTNSKCVTWDSTTAVTAQTIDFPVEWTSYTITKMQSKVAGGGSFTADLKIGGTNVTSCNAVSVSGTSNTNTTCTGANTGSANDIISVVTSSPSGTINQAYVCAVFTHTPN